MQVLLVSGNETDGRRLKAILAGTPWAVTEVKDCVEAIGALKRTAFSVVLCDRDLSDTPWQESMLSLASAQTGACIILISSVTDQYLWAEVVQHGGFDVLTRPFEKESILPMLDFAYTHWKASWPATPGSRSDRSFQ